MMLIETHKEKILGTLYCYDRINIKCTAGLLGFAMGMAIFFNILNRRYFDFHKVFEPVTAAINANAEKIAKENGMEIEYIRNVKAFRKDDKIADILLERGEHEGLVKIYSQLENCTTYKPWTDKITGKTEFKVDTTKRLHYYFYFIDKLLGLCFVKVPTVAPFVATVYFIAVSLQNSLLKGSEGGGQSHFI